MTQQLLSVSYLQQRRLAEAEELLLHVTTFKEKLYGLEHPELGAPLKHLGELYRNQGKYDLAERFYSRMNAIWEKSLGAEHHFTKTEQPEKAEHYKAMLPGKDDPRLSPQ